MENIQWANRANLTLYHDKVTTRYKMSYIFYEWHWIYIIHEKISMNAKMWLKCLTTWPYPQKPNNIFICVSRPVQELLVYTDQRQLQQIKYNVLSCWTFWYIQEQQKCGIKNTNYKNKIYLPPICWRFNDQRNLRHYKLWYFVGCQWYCWPDE